MKVRLVWTGKTRDAHLQALIAEYLQRLAHFVKCEVSEFKETGGRGPTRGIAKDSARISDRLRAGAINVLLDPEGLEWTSTELAKEIEQWQNDGAKEVTFIVGGPSGVSAEL